MTEKKRDKEGVVYKYYLTQEEGMVRYGPITNRSLRDNSTAKIDTIQLLQNYAMLQSLLKHFNLSKDQLHKRYPSTTSNYDLESKYSIGMPQNETQNLAIYNVSMDEEKEKIDREITDIAYTIDLIESSLTCLPAIQRKILGMRYIQQIDKHQVADDCGYSYSWYVKHHAAAVESLDRYLNIQLTVVLNRFIPLKPIDD